MYSIFIPMVFFYIMVTTSEKSGFNFQEGHKFISPGYFVVILIK